jgi:flagellar hook-length control protein FliK
MQTQGFGLGALLGLGGEGQAFLGLNTNNINDFEAKLQSLLGQDVDMEGLLNAVESGELDGKLLPQGLPLDADANAELPLESASGDGASPLLTTDEAVADDALALSTPDGEEILQGLAGLSGEVAEKVRQILNQYKDQAPATPVNEAAVEKSPDMLPAAPVQQSERISLQGDAVEKPKSLEEITAQLRQYLNKTEQQRSAVAQNAGAESAPVDMDGDAVQPLRQDSALHRKTPLATALVRQGAEPIDPYRMTMPAEQALNADKTPGQMIKTAAMTPDVIGMAMQQAESADVESLDPQSWREALQSLSERMPLLNERAPQTAASREAAAAQILQNPALAGRLQASMTPNIINERIQYMMSANKQVADIQLDPPELGALQVRVTTQNDQTNVSFVVANAAVRDVLEQQMPKLREFFEQQGLELGDVDVSDQQSQAQQEMMASGGDGSANDDKSMAGDHEAVMEDNESSPEEKILSQGLVDLFA